MKVLVVGSGGREHALVWCIAKSNKVKKIYCAPGNGGTASLAENIPIEADDINSLADFAGKEKIDLTVVGPEAPLVAGIADEFLTRGLNVFGPSANAAMIEGSKAFAKEVMKSAGIPTAFFNLITNIDELQELVQRKNLQKAAVKADGLAAGKGVFICNSQQEIMAAGNKILQEGIFGGAGKRVVVEELLEGEEASILAFCDGSTVKLMVSSQDHKRALDNDKGPNTGGMGAYSPAPVIAKELEKRIERDVMLPAIKELKKRGAPYVGVLYAGLMVSNNQIKVLEFNARFGDPEAQAVLPRLKTDLVEIMLSCINGKLQKQKIEWSENAACCVVMASGGYPGNYKKGKEIFGLDKSAKLHDTIVFHAGTKKIGDKIFSNGGRVLGVTALGKTINESIEKAYKAVSKISFEKMHFRRDIGGRALEVKLQ